ncbi:hypothetical protein CROQUDRAFT_8795, partial [Cronartium quercuum f. sp. fusiforme G11]
VSQAVGAQRLLIITDYNGTLINKPITDWGTLHELMKKIGEHSEVVIVSRGNGRIAIEHLGEIPGIAIASDLGANLFKDGKFVPSSDPAPPKQVEMVKKIYARVEQGRSPRTVFEEQHKVPELNQLSTGRKFLYIYIPIYLSEILEAELPSEWNSHVTSDRRDFFLRPETENKGSFVQRYVNAALQAGRPYDYVISIGDGAEDEFMYKVINHMGGLSLMIDHSSEKDRIIKHVLSETFAQFRVGSVNEIRELLEHIANKR